MTHRRADEGGTERAAAERLVLAGRFASLVYLNVLVWLSVWVLVPTLLLGWAPMAVDSGSMGPRIRTGDVVLVAPFTGQPIRPGRVITFQDPARPDRLVTHRVTALNDDGTYTTKGDANAAADSTPLTQERIQGVGMLVVPRVGLPVVWLQQRRIAPLALWTASLLLAIGLLGPAPRAARTPTSTPTRTPTPTSTPTLAAASRAVSLPVPPLRMPRSQPVMTLPPAPRFATVPPVRYRLRLPRPPAEIALPAPPAWSVSLVPPAPGTAPVAAIPPPPRPATPRRTALASRDVPGWANRLHGLPAGVLVTVLTVWQSGWGA